MPFGFCSVFSEKTVLSNHENRNIYSIIGIYLYVYIFSRPGRSQGLLYKQPRDVFIHSVVREPFPPTALQRRHAQTVGDSSSSYKIDYVIGIKKFLNPKGHQNSITGLPHLVY